MSVASRVQWSAIDVGRRGTTCGPTLQRSDVAEFQSEDATWDAAAECFAAEDPAGRTASMDFQRVMVSDEIQRSHKRADVPHACRRKSH